MKSARYVLAVRSFAVLAVAVATLSMASAQSITKWGPGQRMAEALSDAVDEATAQIKADDDLGFDDNTCLLATFMEKGKATSFTRDLKAGTTYVFIAGGDTTAEDVDFEVLRDNKVVARDARDDRTAILKFRPGTSGRYSIRVNLADSSSQFKKSFVAVTTLSTDGWSVPTDRMAEAVAGIIAMGAAIEDKMGTTIWQDAENQFAIYGQVLAPNSSFQIDNILFQDGNYTVAGACDKMSDDIDLQLLSNGKVLDEDIEDDSVPIIQLNKNRSRYLSVRLKNEGSKNTFALFGLFIRTGK